MTPQEKKRIFRSLGIRPRPKGAGCGGEWFAAGGGRLEVRSPATGELLAEVDQAAEADYARIMDQAVCAFGLWRATPAPRRGEIVRQVAVALREKKEALGRLVSLEMGKILTEGLGEVQEMIDTCDFAVGLRRTL